MGLTACIEPQCLYKGALYLLLYIYIYIYIYICIYTRALVANNIANKQYIYTV